METSLGPLDLPVSLALPATGFHSATQFTVGGIKVSVHLSVHTATISVERVTSVWELHGSLHHHIKVSLR